MRRHTGVSLAGVGLILAGLAAVGATGNQPDADHDNQSLLQHSGVDLPFDPALAATACPYERGPVKEGSDTDRFKVSTTVVSTTISYLRGRAKPSSYPRTRRVGGAELHTYQLHAYLTQYKIEADGDIHLVLKDTAGRNMIAELPLAACVPLASRWKASIATARARFTQALHTTTSWHYLHKPVTVRGVGYFDPPHGQTGAAKNGLELHPVIGVSFTSASPGGSATSPVTATTPTPTPTVAPGHVRISSIYFNSPGTDDGSNASLDAEWVAITNGTSAAAGMTSWTLTDSSSHTYVFPTFSLPAGATVKVHTGSGTDTTTDLYWGSGAYIWNNTGDSATLLTSSGSAAGSCTYSSSQDPQAFC